MEAGIVREFETSTYIYMKYKRDFEGLLYSKNWPGCTTSAPAVDPSTVRTYVEDPPQKRRKKENEKRTTTQMFTPLNVFYADLN